MSRAYKCDRCGAFYSSNTKVDKITTRRYDNSNAMREFDDLCEECTRQLKEWFDLAPTIEPEVRHGEWHECWHTNTVCASICTNCGKAVTQSRVIVGQELRTNVSYPLCPYCGARMDGGEQNVLDK